MSMSRKLALALAISCGLSPAASSSSDTSSPTVSGVIAYPNPFTPDGNQIRDLAGISFSVDEPSTANIRIKDGIGSTIRSFSGISAGLGVLHQVSTYPFVRSSPSQSLRIEVQNGFAYGVNYDALGQASQGVALQVVSLRPSDIGTVWAVDLPFPNDVNAGPARLFKGHAYVPIWEQTEGQLLAKYDVRVPTAPSLVSITRLGIPPGSIGTGVPDMVIGEDGRAYIASGGDAGLIVVDLNAGVPRLAATIPMPSGNALGLTIDHKRKLLFMAMGDGNPAEAGVRIYDISGPAPSFIARALPGQAADNTALSESGILYVRGTDDLFVLDVSIPASPVTLAQLSTPSGLGSGEASLVTNGRYLYVATPFGGSGTGINIFDIATASSPLFVSFLEADTTLESLGAGGDYLIAHNSEGIIFETRQGGMASVPWDGRDEFGNVSPDGSYTVEIEAIDGVGNASVMETTIALATFDPAPALSRLMARPSVFTPNDDGIRDAASLSFRVNELSTATITIRDGTNAVVRTFSDTQAGLHVLQQISTYSFIHPFSAQPSRIEVQDGFVYSTHYEPFMGVGLQAFSLRPSDFGVVRSVNVPFPNEASGGTARLYKDFVYIPIWEDSAGQLIAKFDVRVPTAPALVSVTTLGIPPNAAGTGLPDMAIGEDGHAFIASGGDAGLIMLDLNTDPPALLATLAAPAALAGLTIDHERKLLFASVATGLPDAGLRIYDLAEPSPTLIGTALSGQNVFNSALSAGEPILYVRDEQGVKILDITNPAAPTVVGTLTGFPGIGGNASLITSGDYLYAANTSGSTGGVYVFDVSTPTVPSPPLFMPAEEMPFFLGSEGNYLVAHNSKGFIFETRPAGAAAVAWDGRDAAQNPVPVGCYTIEVTAFDRNGGQGTLINANGACVSYPDTAAPARVTDLSAVDEFSISTAAAISLQWTAPGDDGALGQIVGGQLDLRFSSTASVYEEMGSQVLVGTSASPGEIQSLRFDGLERGATYHFALRYADEAGNFAVVSNTVAVRTRALFVIDDAFLEALPEQLVSVSASTKNPGAEAAGDLALQQGLQLVGVIYDYNPDGTSFAPPATLSMRYDDVDNDGIVDGTSIAEAELEIRRFNPLTSEWTSLPGQNLDLSANIVTAQLSSFSMYALLARRPRAEVVVDLELSPDTLNLGSGGRFVSAQLAVGGSSLTAADIAPASLRITAVDGVSLSSPIAALAHPAPSLRDQDGATSLIVKFERETLVAVLPVSHQVEVTLKGSFKDGVTSFVTSDLIRTIHSRRLSRTLGGVAVHPSRARVEISSAALPQDLDVTVVQLSSASAEEEGHRDADAARKRLGRHGRPFEFGPEGTQFSSPVTITLPYDSFLLPASVREDSLRIAYWNPQTRAWEELDSRVDTRQNTVSAETTHFSVYQVVSSPSAPQAATELGILQVYAFPNPIRGRGIVTIRAQPGLADSLEVRVYDVSGRQVHASSDFRYVGAFDDGNGGGSQHTYDHRWDVSGVGSGVYTYVFVARKAGRAPVRKTGKLGVIR